MTEAISARGLVKTYGSTRALDGLDLSVATGEVHGFLGPNGAGKTTTLRILLGLARSGHAEALLAGSVSRWRWLRGHLGGALIGVVVLMLGVGSGAGLARSISTGHLGEIPRIVAAASSQLPAIWLVVALSAYAIARSPRLTPVGWCLLAACVILGELGALLGLSHWIMDASPFAHIPRLPGGAVTAMPLAVLTAAAGGTVAATAVTFRRRDVG